ncbi:tetratricopeptide repeat-containing sulfotransferase family protein [Dyella nitratireducens]|uniref:Sulfotransferase n=1 Tax=Dyella nitratireducens TaxID=1849580 RepID=A0ABQ1GIX6_9GAMM|nr:tetratricopeptide repeat-containing sulfotransferase family protein [Dyella nitratireducens]GGA44437.1 sulfotransferase [Dyella nitratireducens]GLQ41743.1 sulfotransferase [Dyella nitratireducens]
MTTDPRALPPVQALLSEAARAFEQGNLMQAGQLALQATQIDPHNAEAHYFTGLACLETGQLNRALEHLNRAVSLNTRSAEYTTHFARALALAQRHGEALQIANIAYALTPNHPLTLDALGGVYMQCNAHERANVLFRRAVALMPDHAMCRFNAAVTYTFTGDLTAAEAEFNACLERLPTHWPAYGLRSRLRRQTADNHHVDALQALLADHANDVDAQIHLHGALGKEYEDLGDYAKAFEHLSLGKAAARQRVAYQPEQDRAMVDALIKAFPTVVTTDNGYGSDEPIFIVGMPRSGTTLVERILSSHPEVYAAGELMNFGVQLQRLAPADVPARLDPTLIAQSHRYDWERLGLRYVDSTRPQTATKPRFIDKLPHNFLYLGLIAKALPKAKIICLRRHPLDTCLSNFRETFAENSAFHGYSFDLLDIGRFYIQFDRMMTHWNTVLPGRILQVDYETLVAEQEATTRRLLEHCELPWNDACLNFQQNNAAVATASTAQVREPMHRRAVGRWEKYRPWLGPLEQLLDQAGCASFR